MSELKETESIEFRGPAGRIEGIINQPAERSTIRAAAVICHAHPLHGGMMHFKVIFRAAKALQSQGLAVLRFNFRGVGVSEGVHDHGIGEQADVRAAIDEAGRRWPDVPLILGGFSFGAAMASLVAVDDVRVRAALLLGFPITRVSSTDQLTRLHQPRLFVQGSRDEFGSGDAIVALVAPLSEPKRLVVIEGADHFFTGRLDDLQTPIERWAGERPWALQ